MKRLFIGIPVSSDQVNHTIPIWKQNDRLSSPVLNWTNPENWHITLVFLGATEDSVIPLLQRQIEELFSDIPAFSTRLTGPGVFPDSNNPKVLWLGIENIQGLIPASERIRDFLRNLGFSIDHKPLKPHLTLARIKNAANRTSINYWIEHYRNFDFGTVEVNRVILYESLSTPDGPVYQPLFVQELRVH